MNKRINFKEKFKQYKKDYLKDVAQADVKRPKWYYFITVGVYLLCSFFLGAMIFLSLNLFSGGRKKIVTIERQLLEKVYVDDSVIAFANYEDYTIFNKELDKINGLNVVPFTRNAKEYKLIFHSENAAFRDFFIKDNELNEESFKKLINAEISDISGYKYKILVSYYKLSQENDGSLDKFPFLSNHILNKKNYVVHNLENPLLANKDLTMIIFYVILLIIFVAMLFKELKVDFKRLYNDIFKNAVRIAVSVAMMFLASIIAVMLTKLLSKVFSYEVYNSVNQRSLNLSLMSSYGIPLTIVVIIAAPIIEELVFRKAMFKIFPGDGYALYFSSLIFGLIHIIGEASPVAALINLVPYFMAGLALGGMYLYSRKNIWIVIYAHLIWNALTFLI